MCPLASLRSPSAQARGRHVGDACTYYHDLDMKVVGEYFTPADKGSMEERLRALARVRQL